MNNDLPEHHCNNEKQSHSDLDHPRAGIEENPDSNLIFISSKRNVFISHYLELQEQEIREKYLEANKHLQKQKNFSVFNYLIKSKQVSTVASESPRLESAPGFQLLHVLEFFCRKKTVELILEPMHAEYLQEYFDALSENKNKKAKLIKLQMNYYLIRAVICEKLIGLIKEFVGLPFKAKSDDS